MTDKRDTSTNPPTENSWLDNQAALDNHATGVFSSILGGNANVTHASFSVIAGNYCELTKEARASVAIGNQLKVDFPDAIVMGIEDNWLAMHRDGRITTGPGFAPTEAAKAFVDALGTIMPEAIIALRSMHSANCDTQLESYETSALLQCVYEQYRHDYDPADEETFVDYVISQLIMAKQAPLGGASRMITWLRKHADELEATMNNAMSRSPPPITEVSDITTLFERYTINPDRGSLRKLLAGYGKELTHLSTLTCMLATKHMTKCYVKDCALCEKTSGYMKAMGCEDNILKDLKPHHDPASK